MNEQLGIDAIFCAAIEIESSDQRQSYLHQACGEDRELRRQVDRLLQAHFRGGRIVDSPAHAMGATIDQRPLEGPGTQVGPYKLLQEIGQGGMGVVYMAEQSKPVERRVALKIIKPGMDTRQVIARFEAERQALAMMDHPNIARVFDAGTTESGRPYFVMELVKGVPITNFCDEHRLTPKQRLELFVPVCQAVQHAHQKGVIHRDLKPSNVLVAEYDDKPVSKVIDFGVAKATEAKLTERTLFTELGQIVGTLEYMSPEQAKLNVLDIDTRSDIYALGVLLYELLTGTTPLEKNCFNRAAFDEMLRIIREEEPPKPSTRLSTAVELPSIAANRGLEPKRLSALVRGELDWLVMKALEKDRNRRYDSANSLAQDIQRYLTDEPVQACPPSAWYRCRKFARRNKGPLGVAAGMFVLVVVIIGGIVGLAYNARLETAYQEEEKHRKQAEHALAVADRAKQGEEGARKQAEQLLVVAGTAKQGEQAARKKAEEALERADRFGYYHSIFLADLALRDDNLPLAQQQLETSPEALRGWEWHYLNAQSHSELFSLSGWGISFRADGTRIAMRGADGLIRVCDSNTGEELQAFQNTLGEGRPVFSPDGTRIAANDRQLRLFDALSGREMFAFGHPLGGVNPRAWPVFSPDGTRIATKFPGGVIRVFDAHSGQETLTFKASPLPFIPAFAPDGRSIAAQGEDRVIRLFDAQSGQVTLTFEESEKFGSPSFNPDGTLVAAFGYFEFAGMVRLFDARTGKPTLTLKGPRDSGEAPLATPAFSPDGTRIAARRTGGGIGVFDAQSGEELLALKGPVRLGKPVFSPDGKRIATEGSDGVIRIFDARSRTGILTLKGPASVEPPFFSPDLTRIAAIGADGLIRLYETANGQESASLKAPVALNSLVFSPDGAQVAAWDADVPIQSFDFATGQPKTPPPPLRSDLTIRLFDARTGMETRSFTVAGYWLSPMFSPDGTQVAIGGRGPDIRVFDTRSGQEIVTFKGPPSLGPVELGAPVWSSDGTRIGACDLYGVTRVFDARKGGELFALKGRLPHARPVFSPDGTCIAALGGDHRVRLFDTQSGQETLTLEQPTNYNPLVFSPDGSQMVASAGDGTLRLFDLRSGAQTHILKSTTTLSGPAFSPDGTRVVSVAVDGVLHLFDAQSGQETLSLKDSTTLSNAVFSHDGTRIMSVRGDHTIRIFAAPRDIREWQAQRRKELTE